MAYHRRSVRPSHAGRHALQSRRQSNPSLDWTSLIDYVEISENRFDPKFTFVSVKKHCGFSPEHREAFRGGVDEVRLMLNRIYDPLIAGGSATLTDNTRIQSRVNDNKMDYLLGQFVFYHPHSIRELGLFDDEECDDVINAAMETFTDWCRSNNVQFFTGEFRP
jgi:hypothetical protein